MSFVITFNYQVIEFRLDLLSRSLDLCGENLAEVSLLLCGNVKQADLEKERQKAVSGVSSFSIFGVDLVFYLCVDLAFTRWRK